MNKEIFRDKLNGDYLLDNYGLIIRTGTAKLLQYPTRKEPLSNDWMEENGREYDLESVRFDDKEVVLSCAFMADDDVEFWCFYDRFFAEITKSGWQKLWIYDHTRSYDVFYRESKNFVKTLKRLKDVEKVFVQFDLILVVK